MRPVEKKKPGEEIKCLTSLGETKTVVIRHEYDPYRDAVEPLSANIGLFCSYCEEYRAISDLAVEHISPKGEGGDRCSWSNFLLACSICNSGKGHTKYDATDTHFPHLDNTFLDFIYDETGRVKVNPGLPDDMKRKAENLFNLVKLGRHPGCEDKPTARDYRWHHRFETWEVASRKLDQYNNGIINIDDIVELAHLYGNWSVWFTVFKGKDEVRKALIEKTPGTCKNCFDPENHYEPVPRNI